MILYLKEIMSAKGVSSVALAEKLGVTKATVSYWINGRVFPNPDEKLMPLAEALGVEVWELFKDPTKGECDAKGCSVTCPHCGHTLKISIE